MENDYHLNYYKSIQHGLQNTEFCINQSSVDSSYFFKEINQILNELKVKKNKIYFFGNGASSAFANHMALDFSKNGNIISRSLSDSALLTALSNDYSYEEALVEYLKIENITINDFVIVISSSGNSPNIVKVLDYCRKENLKSFALTGLKNDNESLRIANYSIYVPMKTYGIVECIHQIFLHLILDKSLNLCEWTKTNSQNMSSKYYNF